jgi:hypothetical protein
LQVSILDSLPEEDGGLDCSAPSWVNNIIDHFNYDQVKAIVERMGFETGAVYCKERT